ncbi:hypothetical protein BD413DRAFT_161057 [Trametes elegans]|nr:hypothetical protein BD413DRAFT_161057 [Trametes elegans]
MPHRRNSSGGTCEVVPAENELPCAHRGYGDRPRLCGTHRKDYSRLTAAYKAQSEDAQRWYTEVRSRDWADGGLWSMTDVAGAIDTAARCVRALEQEILGREEHHRRFFTELHDGHEAWIQRQRKKLREVGAIEAQLCICKLRLEEDEAQAKRQAEEARLALQRRIEADELEMRRIQEARLVVKRRPEYYQRSLTGDTLPRPSTAVRPASCACHMHHGKPFKSAPSVRRPCMALMPSSTSGFAEKCPGEVSPGNTLCGQHRSDYNRAVQERDRYANESLKLWKEEISIIRSRLETGYYQGRDDRITQAMNIATHYLIVLRTLERAQVALDRLQGIDTPDDSERWRQEEVMQLNEQLRGIKSVAAPGNDTGLDGLFMGIAVAVVIAVTWIGKRLIR